MPDWIIVAEPAIEPVTVAELKAQCRIDHTDEDTLLASLIKTARLQVEGWTGRALITQTRRAFFPKIAASFRLPGPPVASVSTLKVYDSANASTTVTSTGYLVDALNGRLITTSTIEWPSITLLDLNPVQIDYVCGYGATAASVPEPIRQAILMIAAHLYEHREAVTLGSIALDSKILELGVPALLERYTLRFF